MNNFVISAVPESPKTLANFEPCSTLSAGRGETFLVEGDPILPFGSKEKIFLELIVAFQQSLNIAWTHPESKSLGDKLFCSIKASCASSQDAIIEFNINLNTEKYIAQMQFEISAIESGFEVRQRQILAYGFGASTYVDLGKFNTENLVAETITGSVVGLFFQSNSEQSAA
jgi:hypothetical protein